MAVERGELIVRRRKDKPPLIQIRIGNKPPLNVAAGEVSRSLLDRLDELNGKEVEFERVGGQPKQVRGVGAAFVGAVENAAMPASGTAQGPRSRPAQQRGHGGPQLGGGRGPDFHNPYNFVPTPPRNTSDPDLGDYPSVAQDSFDPARFTGRIRVRMIAQTPLLIPDTENARESGNGHKTFPLRLDADGKPAIPASSIRGMLRSAYEAVTNSRFARFSPALRNRLAYRMDAREGLRLLPARVENGQIRLLTGTSTVEQDGSPRRGDPQYAAWLPRYGGDGQLAQRAIRYSSGSLPSHGDQVECWLERFQHHRWDRKRNVHVPDFQYWKVLTVAPAGNSLGEPPLASTAQPRRDRQSWHEPLGQQPCRARGWVCVTNANINRKHDERVFFSSGGSTAPVLLPLTDEHRAMWRELIQNYQSIHEDDLNRRDRNGQRYDQYIGHEPGQTAWSRHVYTESDRELLDGTLCYVRLTGQHLNAIFPVMIARELYPVAPFDLLHDSLRPATSIHELSPADRVFGWVSSDGGGQASSQPQGEPVAARGLLRVGPVTCTSTVADAVEIFRDPGVPLAILAAPKPQQGRFYVAKTPQGEAQDDDLSKTDAGYAAGKGLRGRKVYPHQSSLPALHWANPTMDRSQSGIGSPAHYQEYRRPQRAGNEQCDDQNRSILGWVKPGAEFSFDLHVHNLSRVELGALVWLLSLPDGHCLRFGGGKPLGFGSVCLTLAECEVRTGQDLRAQYSSWSAGASAADHRDASIQAFQAAILRSYSSSSERFDNAPFIHAFLAACRGFQDNRPIHYPRSTENGQPGPPSSEGESFRWFVANERIEARHALRNLVADDGLPTLPSEPSPSGQRPPDPGRGGASRRGGRR